VNANPEVYGVQLLQADGLNELAHNNGYADSGDPFPGSTGNTYISDLSTPSAMNYAYDKNGDNEMNEGGGSGIIISDILAGNDHHLSLTITNPNTMSHSFAYDEGNYEGRAYNDNLNFLQWAGIRFQPQDTLVATAVETVFPPSHTGWGVTEINVNLWKGWENYTPQTLIHTFTTKVEWNSESERDGGWVYLILSELPIILLPQYDYFVEINYNGNGGVYPIEQGTYSSTSPSGRSYFRGNTEESCVLLSALAQGDWNIRLVGSQIGCTLENAGECMASCGGNGIVDNCGVCNGDNSSCECPGYPESACDCEGNVYDCNRVCGGSAVLDVCGICDGDGSTCLSVEDSTTPEEFILHQNFPNPFNPVTHIRYSVGEYSQVELRVLDLQGRKLETLQSHYHAPGRYTLTWNAIGLASGVYLVEMVYYNSDKISERLMMKMVVVR
jgi:hypothetical protein